MEERNKV